MLCNGTVVTGACQLTNSHPQIFPFYFCKNTKKLLLWEGKENCSKSCLALCQGERCNTDGHTIVPLKTLAHTCQSFHFHSVCENGRHCFSSGKRKVDVFKLLNAEDFRSDGLEVLHRLKKNSHDDDMSTCCFYSSILKCPCGNKPSVN